ncbi:MAG: flavoprotein [Caldilineaceae bacterium]
MMGDDSALFLFVTGAGVCVQTPDLLRALVATGYTVYSVLTPNVAQVTAPAPLLDVPGNHWIHAYRQTPLERYPFGTLLVAPCTFNTFNKIALGLADNLATAMIADGLGAGCRVIIAPAMNRGLWAHPQRAASQALLQSWGCELVPPQIIDGQVVMAPLTTIVETVVQGREWNAAA